MWRLILLAILLLMTLISSELIAEERLILGLWHCWNSNAIGNYQGFCSVEALWGLDTIPQLERELIAEINANTLYSHFYGLYDAIPVLNYCNSTNGEIKMWIGQEGRTSSSAGYPQYGTWGQWSACNYDSSWFSPGLHNTLLYYDQFGYFGGQAGVIGSYIAHEPQYWRIGPAYWFHGFKVMIDSVLNHDPGSDFKFTLVSSARFYNFPEFTDSLSTDSMTHLDYFEDEDYSLCSPTFGDGDYHFVGPFFQEMVDTLLSTYANFNWGNFKGTRTYWMPVIWVAADAKYGNQCGDAGWTLIRRWPIREEIRLQSFLALASGARGIISFSYSSGTEIQNRDGNDEKIWGLLEIDRTPPIKTDPRSHDDQLVNCPDCFDSYGEITPFDHLAALYNDLDNWGVFFLPLWVDHHYSRAQENPITDDFLYRVYGTRVDGLDPIIAASTLTDTSRWEETRYFMLVNRVTSSCDDYGCPALPQVLDTIAFRMDVLADNGYIVKDMFHGKYWYFTQPSYTQGNYDYFVFSDTIGPGDGKLYRVTPFRHGTLAQNTTFYEREVLSGDITIPDTVTLRIDPGSIINILPDTDVEASGDDPGRTEIIVKGSAVSGHTGLVAGSLDSPDSVIFIPYGGSPQKKDWAGILLDENAACSLSYCSVKYATQGVRTNDYSHAYVSHSSFYRNYNRGIYNYKGHLDLASSRISESDIYGVQGFNSANKIIYSFFADNGQYDIKLEGISNGANDSCLILYDTLTWESAQTPNGIYISGNDRAEVYKCLIAKHTYTALTLSNSNALVHNCVFTRQPGLASMTGIYADNYSFPKIRQCLFDSLYFGVKTYNSRPDLGTTGDYGNCTFRTENVTGRYYIYHDYRPFVPDTFYAQYNYYNSFSPSPSKFYWSYQTSPIKYSPWRTNAPPDPRLDPGLDLPLAFGLHQNYPNPFNPTTAISFALESPAQTTVNIYNILGQRVKILHEGYLQAGEHTLIWDGKNEANLDVASGIYFYTIESGEYHESMKMTLLR